MWLELSIVLQLFAVAALSLVVLSLARQVGLLHRRLTPAGAGLVDEQVLRTGEALEPPSLTSIGGDPLLLASGHGRGTLLLFVSPDCPVCRALLPAYQRFADDHAEDWQLRWLFTEPAGERVVGYAERHGIDGASAAAAPELARRLGIEELPALVALDSDTRVLRREVLTGPRRLEALLAELAGPDGDGRT